jgi:hypothetical protein
MPNQYSLQIIADGPRNAQVKVDGFLDSTDAVLVPLVGLTDFTNNDQSLFFAGFRINDIEYSISSNLIVSLFWEALNSQSIARLTNSSRINFEGGIFPDRTRIGYTGAVLLSTTGFQPGSAQGFTLQIDMIKLYTRGNVISAAA